MTNLGQRLVTALIAIPILVLLFWLGGLWFLLLAEVVVFIGMGEFHNLCSQKGFLMQKGLATTMALLFPAVSYFGNELHLAFLFSISLLLILGNQLRRADLSSAISGTAVSVLGIAYVGWLLSHIVMLRNWQKGSSDTGFFLVVLVIATVFLADTGAYFAGRAFGRHKMCFRISPKKTWEGAVGGVIGGTLGSILTKAIFDAWIFQSFLKWRDCIIMGGIMVIASIVGDLVESMLKRDADIKDSGTIVPGHGGILDRLDSILFALPVAYYYLKLIADF